MYGGLKVFFDRTRLSSNGVLCPLYGIQYSGGGKVPGADIEGFEDMIGGPGRDSSLTVPWGSIKDHVNELGLPNDGYDYNQHLRTMGELRW